MTGPPINLMEPRGFPRKAYGVPIYGPKTLVSTLNIQYTRKHNYRLQTLIPELLIKHFNSPWYYSFSTI